MAMNDQVFSRRAGGGGMSARVNTLPERYQYMTIATRSAISWYKCLVPIPPEVTATLQNPCQLYPIPSNADTSCTRPSSAIHTTCGIICNATLFRFCVQNYLPMSLTKCAALKLFLDSFTLVPSIFFAHVRSANSACPSSVMYTTCGVAFRWIYPSSCRCTIAEVTHAM